jgi:hypothetical protein
MRFIVPCLILWAGSQPLKANELQRLVFNAAGTIGLTALIIESQGITPENSPRISNYINTAITMLNQLASQYFDPPFDSGQIRKIVELLQRFPSSTERMNNRGKAIYLEGCYSNLKTAMSAMFLSNQGVKHNATCDTYVAELGFHGGQALAAAQTGDPFRLEMARSGINQALSMGTMIRGTLGCSFLSEEQARSLNVPNLKTPAEFTRMILGLENDVRLASLNLEPGFDSPATKGTLTAINRTDPRSTADDQQAGIRLVGRWQANSLDGTTIHFVQEGPKIRGYISNLHRYRVEEGYRENELVLEVTRASNRQYAGSFLYKKIFRGKETFVWTPVRIDLADNTSGAGRQARITYTHPTISTGTWQWHYQRVD